jgi:hypothetical protein
MDNRFALDRELNPDKEEIPAVLERQFAGSDISINVVGFRLVSKEEAKAKEQFSVIEKLSPPGKFYTVENASDLVKTLENALRQRLRYWIDREDNTPLSSPDGLDVSVDRANDQWFPGGLQPGGYKVRLYTPQRVQKSIVIEAGDYLLLRLAETPQGLELQRSVWSRDDYPGKPSPPPKSPGFDWRLAVLQNQRIGERGIEMLLTLEKLPASGETVLQLIKPRETWIELEPRTDAPDIARQPYAVRWGQVPGYPAPTWGLNVPAWPAPPEGTPLPPPRLRVWWNPDVSPPPVGVIERRPLPADPKKLEPLDSLAGRELSVDGVPTRIESVAVEDHYVETRPGVREKKSCLVVRLDHAATRVQLRGLQAAGQEHRYYTRAGKYAALFWPMTAAGAESLQGLSIISIASLKREAQQRGYYYETLLGPPQASEIRPRPVDARR